MRLADCQRCGGGIGHKNETLCHRCRAADREAARRADCPGCGRFLRLVPDTGRCVRCSRTCIDCGQAVTAKTAVRCRTCRRHHEAAEAKRPCPRCDRPGYLRDDTGWCGPCSNPGSAPKPPRPCSECGRMVCRLSRGLCGRCWQRNPNRAETRAENLARELPDPPWWLTEFADYAAERFSASRAAQLVTELGGLLTDGRSQQPQAILERARRPGRSAGPLARTLEDFFVERDLAFGLDQAGRLAAGRRQRRVEGAPEPLRPAVELFREHLVRSRERARRAGTRQRSDSTIEHNLAIVRDLARFLIEERHKQDWATVQPTDVEAFVAAQPSNRHRRLGTARKFFTWARRNKIVLVDPTAGIPLAARRGFTGQTLSIGEQRRLFRRWTTGSVHPHEALAGLLALLHAFTVAELRSVRVADIDLDAQTLRVDGRPRAVPLDPTSLQAVSDCLTHRRSLGTPNPHLIITKTTKTRLTPASGAYVTHLLDPAGVNIKTLRSTRLVDLIISLDPKLVAESLGMDANGLLGYIPDDVDAGRLTSSNL